MRVMIVSCSYLLYEYLLKLKNIVLGLVLCLVILSSASASWFCPRPRPRGFVLVLSLVLRSLASINITVVMTVVIGQRWSRGTSLSAGTDIMNINELIWPTGEESEIGPQSLKLIFWYAWAKLIRYYSISSSCSHVNASLVIKWFLHSVWWRSLKLLPAV